MGMRSEQAVINHKSFYTCSGSVLCAFADEIGLSQEEAGRLAAPMASGRMGRCGAVLAAEKVLERKYGPERAGALIERLELAFVAKNQSVFCADLRGRRLRTCRGCVRDAAGLLEQILEEAL